MLKLGVTGSIATGKSTVLAHIATRGIPTISSDDIVRRLYEGAAVAGVEQLFPGVTTDGRVDRKALVARLVAEPERVRDLEALVHPMVRTEIASFFDEAEKRGETVAAAEIPLLFETGHDYGLDVVIVAAVDDATQRRRALARPGMSVEKLEAILARQTPQDEKKARADYVIDTGVSLDDTYRAVDALLDRLVANQEAP